VARTHRTSGLTLRALQEPIDPETSKTGISRVLCAFGLETDLNYEATRTATPITIIVTRDTMKIEAPIVLRRVSSVQKQHAGERKAE